MTAPAVPPPLKRMRLRYDGSCRRCGTSMEAGQTAVYHRADKEVECISCFDGTTRPDLPDRPDAPDLPDQVPATAAAVDRGPGTVEKPSVAARTDADDAPVVGETLGEEIPCGTAGASARREHQRRVAKREDRIRSAHPRLGGFILAVTDEPQSTRAWERGAVGEEKLARSLDALLARGARVLHDRRIPGSRANIDHILVAPAGVFVIDAKRYKGRPHLRVEGGIIRPCVEKLMVGGRDCTKLVTGVHKQVDIVSAAITSGGKTEMPPVRGMLCFIDADWPLIGGAFTTGNVDILWPKKIAERASAIQILAADQIARIHAELAAHFLTA